MTEEQARNQKINDALSFVYVVKHTFREKPKVYKGFIKTMKAFGSHPRRFGTIGIIECVCNLFRGHPELINDFNEFIPPGFKIVVQPDKNVRVTIPDTNPGPDGTSTDPSYVTLTLDGRVPTTYFKPDRKAPQSLVSYTSSSSDSSSENEDHTSKQPPQRQILASESANLYIDKIKQRFGDQSEEHLEFLDIMLVLRTKGIDTAVQLVQDLFREHPDLIEDFKALAPVQIRNPVKIKISLAMLKTKY